jgi:L-cysteine S-thiosulfotransferase
MKRTIAILLSAAVLPACLPGPESASGFRLPDGDADRGLQAFTDLQCPACHSIEGLDVQSPRTGPADVRLGGTTSRVKTYGELVTSIINPSHRIAPGYRPEEVTIDRESRMALARLNEVMTVQQLVDLVAFLQGRYEVVPPEVYPYGYVYP